MFTANLDFFYQELFSGINLMNVLLISSLVFIGLLTLIATISNLKKQFV